MYVYHETVKAYSLRGWYHTFKRGEIVAHHSYDPTALTRYRIQYIKRAIKTGLLPEKTGPTNSMCMLLFWDQRARYIARAYNWRTHYTIYDFNLGRHMLSNYKDLKAKLALLRSAFADSDFTGMAIDQVADGYEHFIPEDDRPTGRNSMDLTPAGIGQVSFSISHPDGDMGKEVRNLISGVLGSPWFTKEHRDAALARMFQPFDVKVSIRTECGGPWSRSTFTEITRL